jgi:hypothetical protein
MIVRSTRQCSFCECPLDSDEPCANCEEHGLSLLPADYEECGECGFDHSYEPREAFEAHRDMQVLTVGDLKDQFGIKNPPILYCEECGCECSANRSDYIVATLQHPSDDFSCQPSTPLMCGGCGQPFKLVRKTMAYVEIGNGDQ